MVRGTVIGAVSVAPPVALVRNRVKYSGPSAVAVLTTRTMNDLFVSPSPNFTTPLVERYFAGAVAVPSAVL